MVPELIKALKDPDTVVRAQAIRALRDFGTDAEAGFPSLLEIWRKESPPPARSAISTSESWIVSSGWIIGPFFGTSSPDLHGLAEEALAAIDPDAVRRRWGWEKIKLKIRNAKWILAVIKIKTADAGRARQSADPI